MKAKFLTILFMVVTLPCVSQVTKQNQISNDCDSSIFVQCEKPPIPKQTKKEIEKNLKEQIKLPELLQVSIGKFYYDQIIDCTGKSIKFNILRSPYPKMDAEIISCIEKNVTWNPGRQNTFPINSLFHWVIEMKNGGFKILTEF